MTERKMIIRLFWPVLIEQSVGVVIAMMSTLMVRGVSEAAMAGVGMLGSFNMMVMNIYIAVSTGVSVIVSQRVGADDRRGAGEAAAQSLVLVAYISAGLGLTLTVFAKPVLGAVFGAADPDVLDAARTYLRFSAITMPFQAAWSVSAGVMRSTGNTRIPMVGSLLSNLSYVTVAWLCIYVIGTGVAGAGLALSASRVVPSIFMVRTLLRGRGGLILPKLSPRLSVKKLSPVLRVALPAGGDALMFEGGKLLTQVFLSGMGTAAIAANSIVSSVTGFINLPGGVMQVVSVTLAGQAYGAGNYKEARKRSWAATGIGTALQALAACALYPMFGFLIGRFDPSPETYAISRQILTVVMIMTPLFWPVSFVLPSCLRASGDAAYTMKVSVTTMAVIRVAGSWLLGVHFGWGLMGIWASMMVDWVARGALFAPRVATMPRRAEKRRRLSEGG